MKKTTIRRIAMTVLAALMTAGYAASGIRMEEVDANVTKVTITDLYAENPLESVGDFH